MAPNQPLKGLINQIIFGHHSESFALSIYSVFRNVVATLLFLSCTLLDRYNGENASEIDMDE